MKNTRKAITLTGRVQGVGFRYFTREKARNIGITGWVKNEPDGSVRVEAQGEPAAIERFVDTIRKGPFPGTVEHVDSEALSPVNNERLFSITF